MGFTIQINTHTQAYKQTNNQICNLLFSECLLFTLEHISQHFGGLTRFEIRKFGRTGIEGGRERKEGMVVEEAVANVDKLYVSSNQRAISACGIEKSVQRSLLEVGVYKEPRVAQEAGTGPEKHLLHLQCTVLQDPEHLACCFL